MMHGVCLIKIKPRILIKFKKDTSGYKIIFKGIYLSQIPEISPHHPPACYSGNYV